MKPTKGSPQRHFVAETSLALACHGSWVADAGKSDKILCLSLFEKVVQTCSNHSIDSMVLQPLRPNW